MQIYKYSHVVTQLGSDQVRRCLSSVILLESVFQSDAAVSLIGFNKLKDVKSLLRH